MWFANAFLQQSVKLNASDDLQADPWQIEPQFAICTISRKAVKLHERDFNIRSCLLESTM